MAEGLQGFAPQPIRAAQPADTPTIATQVAGQQLQDVTSRLKNFSESMMQRHAEVVSKEAAEEGYRDVVDNKTYTEQEAYTVYGKAYNNAASGTYLAQSELLLDSQAQNFAMQYENDPNGYARSMEEFTKGLANKAPNEALRASIGIHGTRLRDRGFGKLTMAANARHRKAQEKSLQSAYKLAIEQAKESAITNPKESLAYVAKGQRILQTMVESGFIDGNTAQLQNIETEKGISKELVLNGYFQAEDKVAYMEELYTTDKMTPAEKKEAIDYIKSDISSKNLIEKGLEEKNDIDEEVSEKAMLLELNTQLVDGLLTKDTLDNALRSGAINLETYTKYQTRINTAGVGVSSPEELHRVRVTLGSQTEETIYNNELLSNQDKKTLVSELRSAENWQSTRLARQANDEFKLMFGIPKGTIDAKLDFENQATKDMLMMEAAIFDEIEAQPLKERPRKALEITRRWMKEYRNGEIEGTRPYDMRQEQAKNTAKLEEAKKKDEKENTSSNAFQYFLDMLPGG